MFLYLKYIMYCNEVDTGLGHGKKKFVRYCLNFYGWLKLMTCSYICKKQIYDYV